MAFSGYVFENSSAIAPYLEEPRTGPTSQFCAEIAKVLNCYVLAGYPEKLSPEEDKPPLLDATKESGSSAGLAVGANSAVFYNPQGDWVGGYRKTNLYEKDMTWAKAGTGFATFNLPPPIQTLSLGICMDLNARPETPWTSLEDGPYELANYSKEKKANLLVLLNAWLDSATAAESTEPEGPPLADDDGKHDWKTLGYWADRLRPLWAKDPSLSTSIDSPDSTDNHQRETIVVICNRSGTENGTTFAGTSSILSMVQNAGRPKLLDMMGKDEEAIRVWNISVESEVEDEPV